jgi:single-strand DNA-binding protein
MSDTTVTVVGNTTRDIELRFTTSGQAVGEFGVAVNKRVKDDSGQWVDGDPEFYDVTLWGTHAENFADSCPRGSRVIVVGRLQFDTWEKDGEKRSKVKIVADHVGPDLRWATASIERVTKDGKPASRPAPRASATDAYDDSEPF